MRGRHASIAYKNTFEVHVTLNFVYRKLYDLCYNNDKKGNKDEFILHMNTLYQKNDIESLVVDLVESGALKTSSIIKAFKKVPRRDFVIKHKRDQAYDDVALSIGYGATISQPYTVAFMLELLKLEKGHKVLDIGSGSGWTAALLAYIVGNSGFVYAVESVAELVEFSRNNIGKYGFTNLKIIHGDGTKGLSEGAPYDRIHVAAAAVEIPEILKEQLAVGGVMVIPTQDDDIRRIFKVNEDTYEETVYDGFMFVPLVAS